MKTTIVTFSIIVFALATPSLALAQRGGGHGGGHGGADAGGHGSGHGGGRGSGGHVSGRGHDSGGGWHGNSRHGAVYANPSHRGRDYQYPGRYYSGYRGFNYGPGYRYGLGPDFGRYGYSYFPWYSGLGLYALGRGYGGYGYNNYGYGGNYSGAYYGESVPLGSQPATEKLPADQDYVPQLNDTTAELAAGASGNAVLGVTMDSQYPQAAVVRMVTPGAPADRAGLRPGDMITSIDQKQVQSFNDVVNLIAGMQPGAQIAIQFVRPILRSEVQAAAPEPQPQQQPSAPVAAPLAPPAPSSLPTPPQLNP